MSRPMLDTRVKELEASFHFNVSVPFELSRLAVPHMLAVGRGSILNIGSVAGRNANRGGLTHSLTKAALAQLTKLMASELAPRIRVNAVLPGAIETAALKGWLDTKGDVGARRDGAQHAHAPQRRSPKTSRPRCSTSCRPPRRGSPASSSRSTAAPSATSSPANCPTSRTNRRQQPSSIRQPC